MASSCGLVNLVLGFFGGMVENKGDHLSL
jgi:hypothetical protein